jgi:transcriptional regulator with XRE-family HTH domain
MLKRHVDKDQKDTLDRVNGQIGAEIRRARQAAGMSQEVLGELIGLTFQQIQKYEKGANKVSCARLWHIAKVLKVAPESFMAAVSGDVPTNCQDDGLSAREHGRLRLEIGRALPAVKSPKVLRALLAVVKAVQQTSESIRGRDKTSDLEHAA